MDTHEYLSALRSRWRLIASTTLIGLLLGALVAVSSPKTYQATARLFVSVKFYGGPSGGTVAGINSTSDFALAQVQSYAKLARSPQVLVPAGRSLGSPIDSSKVSAVNPLNTVLLEVSATGNKPAVVAAQANAVAERMVDFIPRVETRLPDGSDSVKATVIEPATAPGSPISPKTKLDVVVGFLLGLAGGLGLALVLGQAELGAASSAGRVSGADSSSDAPGS